MNAFEIYIMIVLIIYDIIQNKGIYKDNVINFMSIANNIFDYDKTSSELCEF